MKKFADNFQTSRYPWNPVLGCIGALDGIAIKIRKPARDEPSATFFVAKIITRFRFKRQWILTTDSCDFLRFVVIQPTTT